MRNFLLFRLLAPRTFRALTWLAIVLFLAFVIAMVLAMLPHPNYGTLHHPNTPTTTHKGKDE
jgi:hypothetical protein